MDHIRAIIILLVVIFTFLHGAAQTKGGFIIEGTLSGLKDDTRLYLVRNKVTGGNDTVAITNSNREKFLFSGKCDLEPEPYFIKIDGFIPKDSKPDTVFRRKPAKHITIVMENRKVTLKGSLDDLSISAIKISGLPTHQDYIEFQKKMWDLTTPINQAIEQLNLATKKRDTLLERSWKKKYEKLVEEKKSSRKAWVNNHKNSLITPWIILSSGWGLSENRKVYNSLPKKVRESRFGKELNEFIITEEKTAIGSIAPDFCFPSQNGDLISLKQIVKEGKITILDFWASWCKPCRNEFSNLKQIYTQYRDSGLNIFSYSIDKDEKAWRKAIEADSLIWYHVRETFKNAEPAYGLKGIPAMLILDKEGRILAKNLRGKRLSKKIKELLKNEKYSQLRATQLSGLVH
jgi:thiol-disulfide isomerase/thioredoxin